MLIATRAMFPLRLLVGGTSTFSVTPSGISSVVTSVTVSPAVRASAIRNRECAAAVVNTQTLNPRAIEGLFRDD